MSVAYRVTAKPPDGECFIMELFEARSDADAYYNELQEEGDGNILSSVPYRSIVITFEEFLGGQWLMTNRKLVVN